MISNADVIERIGLLLGQELTSDTLHSVLFCEGKHRKILVRFSLGKHTYVHYKIQIDSKKDNQPCADITISGNPNTFRIGLEEKDDQYIIKSEPRINYSYLK